MVQRLFIENDLSKDAAVACTTAQNHYLRNVLRLGKGAEVRVFNGRDGEWRARIERIDRKFCVLGAFEQIRQQNVPCDLHYLFAPLKKARLDYMIQKATEMGASRLQPVLTKFTMARRVKLERCRANAIEAAEQCNLLSIPEIRAPLELDEMIAGWRRDRALVFCDETAPSSDPTEALRALSGKPLAVIIGPEGGFSTDEKIKLRAVENITAISLGPRIMRADTAAVAAMALIQAVAGDWNFDQNTSI